ncbi:MAG: flagellar hook protein FlgE [Marinobacter sp.]|uniref:flagellar hook protein FlgE n=1 Tax=Marinobacter sp. TaxID=50741 RepID=UPI00299EF913|nr:flagellar hook protein FlgE [Marinobacter sp.]MDX1635609.1 flagellar hook protein FlgE [Marinobacter sp.]
MAFNTGLSGLRAASVDLDVTGNNIANASTVGFKGSRVQFGDLYASGFLSSGTNPIGDGVRVQDVQQSFAQGNISFTDNGLDMAVNGDGFFVLNNGGEIRYSRAGQFGVDQNGFVTNNQGMRVQGFQADDDGNLSGVRGDLQIDTDNLAPRRTTNLFSELNLDSREGVLEVSGTTIQTTQPAPNATIGAQTLTVTYPDGSTRDVAVAAGTSAADVASLLNQEEGVSASARTTYDIPTGDIQAGETVTIQGTNFDIPATEPDPVGWLQDAVNNSPLNSVSATVNGGNFRLTESRGNDLDVTYQGGAGPVTATQVGSLNVTLDRELTLTSTGNLLTGASTQPFRSNVFDPNDQRTYNHATSTTIFDSLGNSHEITQYFVKEPVAGGESVWAMYVQVDGRDVGDPPDANGDPSRARFELQFNTDGTLESIDGDPNGEVLISNWTPLDENGDPNGAAGPRLISQGATTPIPEPPVSSNFVIDLSETTQYGSAFGVNDQRQNGYTTGRLSGLDVSDTGILFARYTNGQSQTLGQVALATFRNTDGLAPVGETSWVETFESGQPVIGQPDTGTLGSIKASSLEESNVDLSAELVNLIIAQRNYQANAKTIETADSVTQTIINLR